MSKYVVAFISFFDNKLKQMVVDAASEKDAAIEAFDLGYAFEDTDDLEQAKYNAFNADEMFEVIKL